MTKKNYTHLTLVVDRSGSMSAGGLDKESTNSIKHLFDTQKKVEGEMTVSLYQFDNTYEKVFGPVDIQEVPEYALVPRGATALNDSLYKAIVETGEFLKDKSEDERPEKVIVTVITDGFENASHEVAHEQVKTLVEQQQSEWDWEFVFMASGIDAFATGTGYGIGTTVATAATAKGYQSAYGNFTDAVTTTRTVASASMNSTLGHTDLRDSDDEKAPKKTKKKDTTKT